MMDAHTLTCPLMHPHTPHNGVQHRKCICWLCPVLTATTCCALLTQDGVELLVAETIDGKLDLSDTFVFDASSEIYARPTVHGKLPTQPVLMQCVPWLETKGGDVFKYKEPETKVCVFGVGSVKCVLRPIL